jgi:hypothetical protein
MKSLVGTQIGTEPAIHGVAIGREMGYTYDQMGDTYDQLNLVRGRHRGVSRSKGVP